MKKRTLFIIIAVVVAASALVAVVLWSSIRELEKIRIGSIGLVRLSGTISYTGADLGIISGGGITPSDVRFYVDRALGDPSIRAVIIIINSPGGSAAASEEIYQLIKSLAESKVVVVYGAEVLASGGYYISLPAHRIIVSPHAIVGSVGAVTTLVDISELLGKLGVNITVIKSGEYKDIASTYRSPTDKELEILREITNKIAQIFIERVKEHRVIKDPEVFEARIYLGIDAIEAGLADEVGPLDKAIEMARRLAGLPPYAPVIEIEKPKSLLEMILSGIRVKLSTLGIEVGLNDVDDYGISEFIGKPLYLWVPG